MPSFDPMPVQSFNGPYEVRFFQSVVEAADGVIQKRPMHIIADKKVLEIHKSSLSELLESAACIHEVDALEENKSIEAIPALVQRLARVGIRRDHLLLAIGGGITQDMTCFVASVLFRGIDWVFMPTTLLAQADSCIGSKNSINAAGIKNLVGNFYPPKLITVGSEFVFTLDERDVRSGIGEMLKVHAIDSPKSFDEIAAAYEDLFNDYDLMLSFVRRSLLIKRKLIEIDEFDRGPRNVMNYGHSFGHAIEAATEYAIPHGIAVTMGMDMANYVAVRLGCFSEGNFKRMHPTLQKNYRNFERLPVPIDAFLTALARDKKNIGNDLILILPNAESIIEKVRVSSNQAFQSYCAEFLDQIRMDL